MSNPTVYVVGKHVKQTKDGPVWSFQGVFVDESAAVGSCRTDRYFVGPVPMNEPLPDADIVWPGVYYPKVNV